MTHTMDYVITKRYWSIGEVARQVNQSPSGIRFWLDYFNIEVGRRNHRGDRQFTAEEVARVKEIKRLVKEGYTLKGAKRKLEMATA